MKPNFLDHANFTQLVQDQHTRQNALTSLVEAELPKTIYYGHSHLESGIRFSPLPKSMIIIISEIGTGMFDVGFVEDDCLWDARGAFVACRDMTGRPRAVIAKNCDFF